MSDRPARNDPYQLVTDTILAHLERGVVPWRCPWSRSTGRPRNFHTGREYQGVNVLLLGLLHLPSRWWMTFRQAQERGGSVRKGERGAVVMKWGRHQRAVKNGDGTEEKKTTFFLKSYRVFNAVQIDGIEFPSVEHGPQLDASQRVARAEQIVAQMPQSPIIQEGRTTQASYRPRTDTIEMPAFARFDTPEDFHLTLFHEFRHHSGDWGDVCEEDQQENERSLHAGSRLLSVFRTKAGVKFYIITEHDRSVTTVLLPEGY